MSTEQEMKWVELWEQLYRFNESGLVLINAAEQQSCSLDEAKGLVQEAIYANKSVSLEESHYFGKKAVFITVAS